MLWVLGMAILPSPAWPALSASPHVSFPHPAKVVGLDFKLAPWDGAGMSLDFLDPTRPTLPRIERILNCKFFNLKSYYLNKHIISLFYSTQQDFLPSSFFSSSKVGNKVSILTFSFVFIINKFIYCWIIESVLWEFFFCWEEGIIYIFVGVGPKMMYWALSLVRGP